MIGDPPARATGFTGFPQWHQRGCKRRGGARRSSCHLCAPVFKTSQLHHPSLHPLSSEAFRSAEKKSLVAAERSAPSRAAWHDLRGYLPIDDLVFVDECGSTIALTPLYARAPRGQRAYGGVPRNWGKNTTLIAGLSLAGIQAPFILEGAVDTLAFEIYVEQILAPSLKPGQVVVLDNLSVHKGERVRQAIEAKGCQVLFLPAYSLDLTPIEEAFSKLKAWLRRL